MSRTIPIADIRVVDRLRPIDQAYVEVLAASMREIGQLTPVEVRSESTAFVLTTGCHRLAAARHLGWEKIDADVVSCSAAEARLREIDENLFRHELNPLDRAVFLAQRKEIYEELHPEAKRGGDRRSVDNRSENQTESDSVWSFSRDAAEKTGLGERTIRQAVQIATSIPTELRQRIGGTWLAKKQGELLALAKQPPAVQSKILDLVLAEITATRSVKAALEIVEGRTEPEVDGDARLRKLLDAWHRTPKALQRIFIQSVMDDGFTSADGAVLIWIDDVDDEEVA